jgi:hypothetical protein
MVFSSLFFSIIVFWFVLWYWTDWKLNFIIFFYLHSKRWSQSFDLSVGFGSFTQVNLGLFFKFIFLLIPFNIGLIENLYSSFFSILFLWDYRSLITRVISSIFFILFFKILFFSVSSFILGWLVIDFVISFNFIFIGLSSSYNPHCEFKRFSWVDFRHFLAPF